jgi:hypothetical protein
MALNVFLTFLVTRMPLHYMSLLTVSVGLHSVLPLDAPLTRRINKAVLHNNFNAANYVSK